MTLVALACYGDYAEFITDSTSYTRDAAEFGRCTKHMTLNHLDAVVIPQGMEPFGAATRSIAHQLSQHFATFDELVDGISPFLEDAYNIALVEHPDGDPEATVILVGYSPQRERFASFVLASEDEFEPVEVRGLWMLPTPWTDKPSRVELDRVRGWWSVAENPRGDEVMKIWANKPRRPKPGTLKDWEELAYASREQRSLSGIFGRVFVTGEVTHTRLDRDGGVHSQRIVAFNDEGEEFQTMVSRTLHPLALAEACFCDSGLTFGECCVIKPQEPAPQPAA